jgi:hypothetical protein
MARIESRKTVSPARIPLVILIFFIIDGALVAAYMLDFFAGHPYWRVTRFLDPGAEGNLPTWYSSIQWYSVATLLAIFTYRNFRISQIRSWLLLALPLVFLTFSLDEVAMIHEQLGTRTDVFLFGRVSRETTPFFRTGIWVFVIGVPFVVLFGALVLSIQTYFQRALAALVKMLLGMAITLTGALGIETLSNFVDFVSVSVVAEELCEMLGGTIVLWGSYELLRRHGFELRLDEAQDTGQS